MVPSLVLCRCSPSSQRFKVLRLQRCSSVYLDCNKWLSELLLVSFQLLSGHFLLPSSITRAFFLRELQLTRYCLFCFGPFSVNLRDSFVEKQRSQEISSSYIDQPIWDQQSHHVQNQIKPGWTSADYLDHFYLNQCIELLTCNWLIDICVNNHLNRVHNKVARKCMC